MLWQRFRVHNVAAIMHSSGVWSDRQTDRHTQTETDRQTDNHKKRVGSCSAKIFVKFHSTTFGPKRCAMEFSKDLGRALSNSLLMLV